VAETAPLWRCQYTLDIGIVAPTAHSLTVSGQRANVMTLPGEAKTTVPS